MWTYNYTDTLMHYGVLGMRWGKRKATNLYKKIGKQRGYGDWYRDQGDKKARKYDSAAAVMEQKAKQYKSKGDVAKAESSRLAAAKLKDQSAKVRREFDLAAAKYYDKASRIEEKVSRYATKKNVELGKDRVDRILKYSSLKAYNAAQREDDIQKVMRYEAAARSARDAYNSYAGAKFNRKIQN